MRRDVRCPPDLLAPDGCLLFRFPWVHALSTREQLLFTVVRYPSESMIDLWFEGNKLGSSEHLPIFDYLTSLERDTEQYVEML